MNEKFIVGFLDTVIGKIPKISSDWVLSDYTGAWKARWNIGRMEYRVKPGLYVVGEPDNTSPVFISANYKMSFDHLRRAIKNINCWIIVLDTKGVNVWCAAGKGTFGTDELIKKINETSISELVSHKKLIVPQLGAPGISAHRIKKETDFTVVYGPVDAYDIPEFLKLNMTTTKDMRKINFSTKDRLILIPLEFVTGLKLFMIISIILFILSGINSQGYSLDLLLKSGLITITIFTIGYICGSVIAPLLLPLLPGRAFSLKGFILGLVVIIPTTYYLLKTDLLNIFTALAWLLVIPALSSFLSMNFTGASTFTSLSGVKREMRIAFPIQIILFFLGAILWITGRFI